MEKKAPNKYVSMAHMRCPNCREGHMYTNKSVFPLGKMLDMPERCLVCDQKFEIEPGFWYGTGYVSYAISVGMIFCMAVIFGVTVGFSWENNSVYVFIGIMIASMVVFQPWIMRYSRVLYLYVFVKYKRGNSMRGN